MAILKPHKTFKSMKKGMGQKTKYRPTRRGLDLKIQQIGDNIIAKKKVKKRKQRTSKQLDRQDLFCDCDLLYKILNDNANIFLSFWFYGTSLEVRKNLSKNNFFMSRCMKKHLVSLLKDTFFLNISLYPITELYSNYFFHGCLAYDESLALKEPLYEPRAFRF